MGLFIIFLMGIQMYAEKPEFSYLSGNESAIRIEEGTLQYCDAESPTISGINMVIPVGQWTCILGKSGCGKSTLLRYLAGLLDTKVHWNGRVLLETSRFNSEHSSVIDLGIKQVIQTNHIEQNRSLKTWSIHNQIAYMGQQDLLMPWLSALDNVLLSTRFSKASKDRKADKEKALNLLNRVGLADKHKRLPQHMSGGMRQRVAIARTLMQNKPIVLMDEPFSALDAVNRHKLQNLACELLQNKTVLLITHDPQEALRLASQLYIMHSTPTRAQSLPLPSTLVPRKLDSECAALQQSIIERLEKDYE